MMHGQVLEVAPSDPARAIALLREAQSSGQLKADEVALYGLLIHVIGPEIMQQQAAIAAILRAGGVDPGAMTPIPPSLEDVFIANVR
jgi:hypothetical protein